MSKAGKYKVMVGEQFLGHFSGNTPEVAMNKAISRNKPFHSDKMVAGSTFTMSRGSSEPVSITLGADA